MTSASSCHPAPEKTSGAEAVTFRPAGPRSGAVCPAAEWLLQPGREERTRGPRLHAGARPTPPPDSNCRPRLSRPALLRISTPRPSPSSVSACPPSSYGSLAVPRGRARRTPLGATDRLGPRTPGTPRGNQGLPGLLYVTVLRMKLQLALNSAPFPAIGERKL